MSSRQKRTRSDATSATGKEKNVRFGNTLGNIKLKRIYYTVGPINLETITCDWDSVVHSSRSCEELVMNSNPEISVAGESETINNLAGPSSATECFADTVKSTTSAEEHSDDPYFEPNAVNIVSLDGETCDNYTKAQNSADLCETEILNAIEDSSSSIDYFSGGETQTALEDDSDSSCSEQSSISGIWDSHSAFVMKSSNCEGVGHGTTENCLEQNSNVKMDSNNSANAVAPSNSEGESGTTGNSDYYVKLEVPQAGGSATSVKSSNPEEAECESKECCGLSSESQDDELNNSRSVQRCKLLADKCGDLTPIADSESELCFKLQMNLTDEEEGRNILPSTPDKFEDVNISGSEDDHNVVQSQLATDSDRDLHLHQREDDSDHEMEFPSIFRSRNVDTTEEISKNPQVGPQGLLKCHVSSAKYTTSIADVLDYTSTWKEGKVISEKLGANIPLFVVFPEEKCSPEIKYIREEPNEIAPNTLNEPPPGLKIIIEGNLFCLFSQKDVALQINNSTSKMVSKYETILMNNPTVASKILPAAIAYLNPSCIKNHDAFLTYLFKMAAVSSDVLTVHACEKTIKTFVFPVCTKMSEAVRWCPPIEDLCTIFLNYGIDLDSHCPIKQILQQFRDNIHPQKNESDTENQAQSHDWSVVGINFSAVIQILTSTLTCCCTYSSRELSTIVVFLLWLSLDVKLLLSPVQLAVQNCVVIALDQIPEENWCTEMKFLAEELCKLGQHHRNILKVIKDLPPFVPHSLSLQQAAAFMAIQNFLGISKTDTSKEIDCIIDIMKTIAVRLSNKEPEDFCVLDTVISLINIVVNHVLDKIPVESFNTLCSLIMKLSAKIKADCNFPEKNMVRAHLVQIRCNWIFQYPSPKDVKNEDSKESTWDFDEDSDASSELYSNSTSNKCSESDDESYIEEFSVSFMSEDETQDLQVQEQLSSSKEVCDAVKHSSSSNITDSIDNGKSLRTECRGPLYSDVTKPIVSWSPSSNRGLVQVCSEDNGNFAESISKTTESDWCESHKVSLPSSTDAEDLENIKFPLTSQEEMREEPLRDCIGATKSVNERSDLPSSILQNCVEVRSPDNFKSLSDINKEHVSEGCNTQNGCDAKVEDCFEMTVCTLIANEVSDEYSESRSPVLTEPTVSTFAEERILGFCDETLVNTTFDSINTVHKFQSCEKQVVLADDSGMVSESCFEEEPESMVQFQYCEKQDVLDDDSGMVSENRFEEESTSMVQFSGKELIRSENVDTGRTSESLYGGSEVLPMSTCGEHVITNMSEHFYLSKGSDPSAAADIIPRVDFKSVSLNDVVQVLQDEKLLEDHGSHTDVGKTDSHASTKIVSVVGHTPKELTNGSHVMSQSGSMENDAPSAPLQIQPHDSTSSAGKAQGVSSLSVAFLDSVLTYKTNDPKCIPFICEEVTSQENETSALQPEEHSVFKHMSHDRTCSIPLLEDKVKQPLVQETEETAGKFFESIARNIINKNIFNKSTYIPFISDDEDRISSTPALRNDFNYFPIYGEVFPLLYASKNSSFAFENPVVELNTPCVPEIPMLPCGVPQQNRHVSSNALVKENTLCMPGMLEVPNITPQQNRPAGTNGHRAVSTPVATLSVHVEPRIPFIVESVEPVVVSCEQKTYATTPLPLDLFHKNNKIPFISEEDNLNSSNLDVEKHSVTASIKPCANIQHDSISPVKTSSCIVGDKMCPPEETCVTPEKDHSTICSPLGCPKLDKLKTTLMQEKHSCSTCCNVTPTVVSPNSFTQNSSDSYCSHTSSSSLVDTKPSDPEMIVKGSDLSVREMSLVKRKNRETGSSSTSTKSDTFKITLPQYKQLLPSDNIGKSKKLCNFKPENSKTVSLHQQEIASISTAVVNVGNCDNDSEDCVLLQELITVPD